ncbi:hypothetical protein BKA69DRAFT_438299 [Paraphysoderma sedebokerense]|nr:hypothetical protein BKA69DRAFT_438299 [Paraphysoderma sedebokerense]
MKIFENKLDENMPGLKSALDCIGYVGDEHQRFAKVISDNCIKRLENLKHDFTKKLKNIKGDIDTAMTAVTKERQETMEAIQEHRKAHEMVNVRRGTSGDLTDPWLTEKALQMQLERMVQQENYYQMRMLAIQNDIKECEKVLVVTLKAIADDFVFGKETSFTHLREHMGTIKAVIDRIDPTFHFDTFVAQHNITGSPIWHKERTVRDFTYKSNEEVASSVLKEGIIQRPGTIRKSHWKNSWWQFSNISNFTNFTDTSKKLSQVVQKG